MEGGGDKGRRRRGEEEKRRRQGDKGGGGEEEEIRREEETREGGGGNQSHSNPSIRTSDQYCGCFRIFVVLFYLQPWGAEPWEPCLMLEPGPGSGELARPLNQNLSPAPSPSEEGEQ